MKILVYGAKSWIGQQFTDLLQEKQCAYVAGTARVDDEKALGEEIDREKPTHVISLIGRTHGQIGDRFYNTIDYLEQPGKLYENVRDNLFAPLLLAEQCRSRNIHFTYLGTGCIFKYDEQHPFGMEENGFREDSLPNYFGSSYSIVKGFTDRLMQKLYGKTVLNLRIRMPISNTCNGRNFIDKITSHKRVCSVPNSMSVLPELLPIALDMMAKQLTGTLNLTNPGLISHNRFLEMYREIVDANHTWENLSLAQFSSEQQNSLAADRANNYLDTSKLKQLYPHVSNIEDAVRECLQQYRDSTKRRFSGNADLSTTGGDLMFQKGQSPC